MAELRLGDVDLAEGNLRARITKSRIEDDMPITSDLAVELRTWLQTYRAYQIAKLDRVAQPSDFLFPARRSPTWRWGDPRPDGSRDRVSVPGGWDPLRPIRKPHVVAQDALGAVGFPQLHEGVHTLRRGAARLLFDSLVQERGYDGALRVVSSFHQHSNVTTTERYLGLGQERRVRDLHLRGRSLLGPRPTQVTATPIPLTMTSPESAPVRGSTHSVQQTGCYSIVTISDLP